MSHEPEPQDPRQDALRAAAHAGQLAGMCIAANMEQLDNQTDLAAVDDTTIRRALP